MSDILPSADLLRAKLNLETAPIHWHELQRFFAMGKTIVVSSELDLVDVGARFSADDQQAVADWLALGQVSPVSDQQAQAWLDQKAQLWCLVVRPWVLVQELT